MGGRVDRDVVELSRDLAREGVELDDAVDLVAEELDAEGLLLVGGEDLDRVAADPELAPDEVDVVALVLDVDELLDDEVPVGRSSPGDVDDLVEVLLGGAEAEDAGDAGDDEDVVSLEEGARGGVPEALDLVVDRGVLLYVGVGARDVGLGLVVVVVGDEVLDGVVREELLELVGELGRQGLVRGDDEGGLLDPLEGPGRGGGLAGPGGPKEGRVALASLHAPGQALDSRGLVSGGLEIGFDLERGHDPV